MDEEFEGPPITCRVRQGTDPETGKQIAVVQKRFMWFFWVDWFYGPNEYRYACLELTRLLDEAKHMVALMDSTKDDDAKFLGQIGNRDRGKSRKFPYPRRPREQLLPDVSKRAEEYVKQFRAGFDADPRTGLPRSPGTGRRYILKPNEIQPFEVEGTDGVATEVKISRTQQKRRGKRRKPNKFRLDC